MNRRQLMMYDVILQNVEIGESFERKRLYKNQWVDFLP